MIDPYAVLGVPRGASGDIIDEAYKRKAREYRENGREDKLSELNDAYDQIILNSRGGGYSFVGTDFSDIYDKIKAGRLEDAQLLLDGVPVNARNAEWYYLRGMIYERKGWLEEAVNHYARANSMDPSNREYKDAYNRMNNARSGGYRTSRKSSRGDSGCSACDVITGLLCADCCCECFGGDIIPCC